MTVVRVIGCGNPDAGDDAAGIVAVQRARRELESISGVEVRPMAGPLDIVHLVDGVEAIVVVDAIRTPGAGRPSGTIVRAEAGPHDLPAEIRSSLSSHGFGVMEAYGVARAVGRVPRFVVVGVESEQTTAGRPMSEAVRAALPDLMASIVREARSLASQAEGAATDGSGDPTSRDRPEAR